MARLARMVAALFVLAAAPAALAADNIWDRWRENHGPGQPGHGHGPGPGPSHHSVPEFDPAAGGALAVLLAGGAMFVANRRRSK